MGLLLFNQAGQLAFSANNNCMRFLEKRVVNRTDTYYQATITSSVGAPIIFIRPAGSEFLACYLELQSGNNYTFRAYASGGDSAPATLTWYIFVADMIQATGYGINAYKADGSIAFSTASRLLKISGYYMPQAESPPGVAASTKFPISSGSVPAQYAVCVQTHGFSYLPLSTIGSTFILLLGGRIGPTQLFERGGIQVIAGIGALRDGTEILGPLYVPLIDTTLYD
jgi:hypothetical protein